MAPGSTRGYPAGGSTRGYASARGAEELRETFARFRRNIYIMLWLQAITILAPRGIPA